MHPVLSVAVLVIALSVLTDSATAEDSPMFDQNLNSFFGKLLDFGNSATEKATDAYQNLKIVERIETTGDWVYNMFKTLKDSQSPPATAQT